MGSFLKYLQHGVLFYVGMIACKTQTAIANGEFGVSEQLATTSGDMTMQTLNRQF